MKTVSITTQNGDNQDTGAVLEFPSFLILPLLMLVTLLAVIVSKKKNRVNTQPT